MLETTYIAKGINRVFKTHEDLKAWSLTDLDNGGILYEYIGGVIVLSDYAVLHNECGRLNMFC